MNKRFCLIPWLGLPTIFDEALSYLEQLLTIKNYIKVLGENQKITEQNLKNLKNFVDEQLETYTKEQLEEWKDDGTLENLVNQAVAQNKLSNNVMWYHCFFNPHNRIGCQIVKFSNNEIWLFDSGDQKSAPSIVSQMQSLSISKIDGIVITHYHYDHAGGLETIAKSIDINNAKIYLQKQPLWSKQPDDLEKNVRPYYNSIQNCISQYNLEAIIPNENYTVTITEFEKIIFQNCNADQYYSDLPVGVSYNYNNTSLIANVFNGNKNICIPGDLYPYAQQVMSPTILESEIMIAPHHGEMDVTYYPFWEKSNPKILAICAGNGLNIAGDAVTGADYNPSGWALQHGKEIYLQNTSSATIDFYVSQYDYYTPNSTSEVWGGRTFSSSYGETGLIFDFSDYQNVSLKSIIKTMKRNSSYFGLTGTKQKINECTSNLFGDNNTMYEIHDISGGSTSYSVTPQISNNRRGIIKCYPQYSITTSSPAYYCTEGLYYYNSSTDELFINWLPVNVKYFLEFFCTSSTNNVLNYSRLQTNASNAFTVTGDTASFKTNNSAYFKFTMNILNSSVTEKGITLELYKNGTSYTSVGVPPRPSGQARPSGTIVTIEKISSSDNIEFRCNAESGFNSHILVEYYSPYEGIGTSKVYKE